MEKNDLDKLFKEDGLKKDHASVIQRGLEKTQRMAEAKAIAEKAQLKELLEMSEFVGEIAEALLTVEHAAVQLGVSSQTIRNWEKQGILIPAHKTEGGHRRYHQSQITELKKSQNDFEIFVRIKPANLILMIQQVMSNFNPEEIVSVSIQNDPLKHQVRFTLDSEDGLCTFTKTLKMEE